MKRETTIDLGGLLATGDVVGVAYSNCIIFGWYVEGGQYGSLKFIDFKVPQNVEAQYNNYINGALSGGWYDKRFGKGLRFNHFRRDYIVKFSPLDNRVFKVSNPAEFFKGTVTEAVYLAGKSILNNHKFPAK